MLHTFYSECLKSIGNKKKLGARHPENSQSKKILDFPFSDN